MSDVGQKDLDVRCKSFQRDVRCSKKWTVRCQMWAKKVLDVRCESFERDVR